MGDALRTQLLLLVLPIILGGPVYAGVLMAAKRFAGAGRAGINRKVALGWLLSLSLAFWLGYEVVDARAAAVHQRNIGIPIVFIWGWATLVLPAPLIGTVMLALGERWLGSTKADNEP